MSVNSAQQFLNVRDSHLRVVSGNVHADQMVLGGITVDTSHGLQSITNTSNVTTNTVEFSNATTAFVTTANVEVGGELTVTGNATVSSNLTVTGNAVTENLLVSNNLTVTGNAVTENLLVSNNLTVTGNTFYTNPAAVLVDSNVVTEYTGPHDRPLRKYPEIILPRAAVGAEYNGYRIDRSSEHVTATYDGVHDLFNETAVDYTDTWGAGWQGTSGAYSTSTGEHTAYVTGGTTQGTAARLASNVPNGEWVSLQVSTPIKLDNVEIRSRNVSSGGETQFPKDFEFWGSDDGTTWYHIKSFTGVTSSGISVLHKYNVNSTTLYNRFALVVTKIPGETSSGANDGAAHFSISELRFNGYEEGSGSLDTTLKSVYNVPATTGTQLEVYYDAKETSSYSGSGTTVTDLALPANNGTLDGVGFDSTYKAFTFDGDNDKIDTALTGFSDTGTYTVSLWIKSASIGNSVAPEEIVYQFGHGTQGEGFGVAIKYGNIGTYIFSGQARRTTGTKCVANEWFHATFIYTSNGSMDIYINGVLDNGTLSGTLQELTIPTNPFLTLGVHFGGEQASFYTAFFNGSIANFRLYSKALNADQVKELYDYQKDYFLGSKSQVTLYKGHLGVGVTEPSGQLELAGDERIQEYPPGPMDDYDTHIPGHGVFCASASSQYNSSYAPWKAFRKFWDTDDQSWASFNETVTKETGLPSSTAANFQGILGNWIQLKLPYKIDLHSFKFESRDNVNFAPEELPGAGIVYGSNDEVTWDIVHSFSGVDYGGVSGTLRPVFTVKSNTSYSIFRLLVTKNYLTRSSGTSDLRWAGMGAWRLFGTPGPTTLDKGSLSLTRSLDVPRVSRYDVDTETPRPEKLVVDFDTTVNSSPTDISGQGNHGTLVGATYSAADKAFNFDGGDYIQGTLTNSSNFTHTTSVWFKMDDLQSTLGSVSTIGNRRTIFEYGLRSGGALTYGVVDIRSAYMTIYFGDDRQLPISVFSPQQNQWHHLVMTYSGSGTIRVFVDNVEYTSSLTVNANNTLALPTNTQLLIGSESRLNSAKFRGDISNFKVYNVALEPSEVQKLYRLGRTGRSMVISDTAVGIGKVPEAQLDVRGIGMFQRVGIGMNNMPLGEKNDTTRRSTIPTLTMYNEMEDSSGGPTIRMQSNHGKWDLMANENTDHSFDFDFNETNVGYLRSASYNDKDMNNFTGQHRTFIKDVPFSQVGELEGLIVSSDQNKYIKMSGGIEVGSNAITTNESLPVVSLSNVVTDKKCFGVISASEDPEKREEMYGNFGSVFEKEKGDTRVYINSVGEGAIWVTDINGSLESGDYITTSNVAGYGQKQNGAGLMNYTVAKITMDCDFEPVTQSVQIIKKDEHGENVLDEHGQIQWEDHPTETEKAYKIRYLDAIGNITDEANHVYKAAFVGCTYHCG